MAIGLQLFCTDEFNKQYLKTEIVLSADEVVFYDFKKRKQKMVNRGLQYNFSKDLMNRW